MINYAVRYRPIVEMLHERRPAWVLDVGSGPEGLAMFWRGTVVGNDLHFKRPPIHHGVAASSLALPFGDGACPVVVSCDMLEHVPPPLRQEALNEMARVTGKLLLLGFPSGERAMQTYRTLSQRLRPSRPPWLEEHLAYGLPDADETRGWLHESGWNVTLRCYESAPLHERLVYWEHHLPIKLFTYGLMRLLGPWLVLHAPVSPKGHPLRVLICAERAASPARSPAHMERLMSYTQEEMMVVATAREIGEGEVLFAGTRLALRAFALAKRLHAPRAVALCESGVVQDEPAGALAREGEPASAGAAWAGGTAALMGLLAQGHVGLGILGGAQVDRFGNVNTSYIGGYVSPTVRLPGSGGASDIASLAQRLLLVLPHERRRFVEQVDYLTSPGHGTGEGWREAVGLPVRLGPRGAGGPTCVVTSLALLRFDEEGEMRLASLHPGVTVEQVRAQTGWPLALFPAVERTPPPSDEELAMLRRLPSQ